MPFFASHMLGTALIAAANLVPVAAPPLATGPGPVTHKLYGVVRSIAGNRLVLRDRFGKRLLVDVQTAHANVKLFPGRPVIVFFQNAKPGEALRATAVWRTFPDAAHWPADR